MWWWLLTVADGTCDRVAETFVGVECSLMRSANVVILWSEYRDDAHDDSVERCRWVW